MRQLAFTILVLLLCGWSCRDRGEDSKDSRLEEGEAGPDLSKMTFQQRLDHYVERGPTIAEASPQERRAFTKWRREDFAKITDVAEKFAFLNREKAAREAYRQKLEQSNWAARCGDRAVKIFNNDPNHLWNRVYRALYVRIDRLGCHKGFDVVDPYLYGQTRRYLEGAEFEKIMAVLSEFHGNAAAPSSSFMARAIMQRNLLHVYHWAVEATGRPDVNATNAKALANSLAAAIRLIALTESEILALPANLSAAINSGAFETGDILRATPAVPYLPAGLAVTDSNFQVLSTVDGPAAPVHTRDFRYGSAFFVYYALPGSARDTLRYLSDLQKFGPRMIRESNGTTHRNLSTPQIPPGTQVAIVRKAILWAREGRPVISPITESVQGRIYSKVGIVNFNQDTTQMPYLLHLSQAELLAGKNGGLENFEGQDHLRFLKYADPFETGGAEEFALGGCTRCHSQQDLGKFGDAAGIHSIISYTRIIGFGNIPADPVYRGYNSEAASILQKVKSQSSWRGLGGGD